MSGCAACVSQGLVHSYREAFEDVEADGFAHSAPYGSGGGGENSPQTPRFPVSPQTPYFNMCRFTLSKQKEKKKLQQIYLGGFKFIG